MGVEGGPWECGEGIWGGTWPCGGHVGVRWGGRGPAGRGDMGLCGDLGVWVLEERSGQPSLLKGKPVSFPAPGVVVTIQVFRLPCSDPGKAIARICNELLV